MEKFGSKTAVINVILAVVILAVLSIALRVDAAVITAANCSQAAVGGAVAAASDGDVVLIPGGTCSWTTTLAITKGITLQGAGIGQTVILDNIYPHTAPILVWNVASPRTWRMTGMTIARGSTTDVNFQGTIQISGNSEAMRIDHVRFENLIGIALKAYGNYGVIDHCQFVTTSGGGGGPIFIHFSNGLSWKGVGQYGDNSWATPSNYGSSEFIFLEDNTFSSEGNHTFDADNGARFVARYNNFTNTTIETHGTESTGRVRGFRVAEIYSNQFTDTTPSASQVIHFRSGTGVIFNNTLTGYQFGGALLKSDNFRDVWNTAPWGSCNGTSAYDQNIGGQAGYACIDQVGRGPGALLWDNPAALAWPNQALEPVYMWGNALNGAWQHQAGSGHVVTGRDVLTDTSRPGYTPYRYPHPLVDSSGSSDPPAGSGGSTSTPVISISPSSVTPGGSATATWSGIGAPTATDWIGLYAPGTPDNADLGWIYVSCTQTAGPVRASGSCLGTLPNLAAGTYELRLYTAGTYTRLATSASFSVSGTALGVSPSSVFAGSSLTASWNGIAVATPTDWIGLYAPGMADSSPLGWIYVSCSQTPGSARVSGSCTAALPAGTYEIRLFSAGSYTRIATSNIFSVR